MPHVETVPLPWGRGQRVQPASGPARGSRAPAFDPLERLYVPCSCRQRDPQKSCQLPLRGGRGSAGCAGPRRPASANADHENGQLPISCGNSFMLRPFEAKVHFVLVGLLLPPQPSPAMGTPPLLPRANSPERGRQDERKDSQDKRWDPEGEQSILQPRVYVTQPFYTQKSAC